MRTALGILLTICMTQIAGCAFGTRYIELSYPPAKQVKWSLPETQPAVPGPRTRNVLLAVNDDRETRDRIGAVSAGFGMDTASVLTEVNIEVWVYDAIEFELNRLGFETFDQRSSPPNASADRLTADVQKVYCDIRSWYHGEVTLQATLERADNEPSVTEYPTEVKSGLNWASSGRAAGESVTQALQTAIHSMLYDLGYKD